MSFRRKTKIKPDFSLASMTDMVFLLLIFFMITSTLVSPNAIKVSLPKANSQVTTKTSLAVSVTEDLKFYVEGTETTREGLPSAIAREIAKSTSDEQVISLNIDKAVAVEHLVYVMQTCNNLKTKVVLATQPD